MPVREWLLNIPRARNSLLSALCSIRALSSARGERYNVEGIQQTVDTRLGLREKVFDILCYDYISVGGLVPKAKMGYQQDCEAAGTGGPGNRLS